MSLDFYLEGDEKDHECVCRESYNKHNNRYRETFFSTNITHNLGPMFNEADVYKILWHGDGMIAGEVLPKLETALMLMRADPPRFKKHNAPNGWGLYENAVPWLAEIVAACREYPQGVLRCSR